MNNLLILDSSREYHMYNPHVRARYKFNKQAGGAGGGGAGFLTLDLTLKLITFKDASGANRDLAYYEWD